MARRELSPEEVKQLGLDAPSHLREISPEEAKSLGLDQPTAAPAEAPGVGETMLDRFLKAFMPGNGSLIDDAKAQGAANEGAGFRPSFSLNRGRTDVGQPGIEPTKAQLAESMRQYPAALAATQARAAEGGEAHPLAAGLANVGGTAASLAMLPGAGKAMRTVGPAAEALGPFLGKWGAKLLTRAAAGGALGGVGAAYKGQDPSTGIGMGLAAGAAPVLSGLGASASALMPGLSSEERATRAIGGALPAAFGATSTLAESVPALRQLAEENAIRAQGQKLRDIRKAGGVEGARAVGRTLLDEGAVPRLGDAETIGANAAAKRNEVGQSIAAGLDKVNTTLSPELQTRLRPFVVAAKVGNDVMPGLEKTAAQRPLIPAGQGIVQDIQAVGGQNQAPMSFAELNRQKTEFGNKAYAAANPLNPSPQAGLLQDVYRSLNSHMENVGGDAAKEAGSEAFGQWLADKQRYGNLEKAAQTGQDASMRGLANRRVSPSDYLVGAGQAAHSGIGPKAILMGAANKALRERGPAFAARGFDDLANLGGKLPNIWGTPLAETPSPVAPAPPPAPLPGALPPPGAPTLPPAGTVTPLPAPGNIPGNPAYNNASKFMYQTLVERLAQNKPFETDSIVNPHTGEMLLPAKVTEPLVIRKPEAGPGYSTENLPPVVPRATAGALEPLTPRLQRALGTPPVEVSTKNERAVSDSGALLDALLGKTRKSPPRGE